MSHLVVVGAGAAGLTIADQLASRGQAVTVVERQDVVGGLARSWHYGDFHFDVGPHRFHTENPRVARYIRDVLGRDAVEISRKSGVRMFGGFHEWPLRPSVLLSMPLSLMLRGSMDLLRKQHLPGESFEADVVNKYGRTLYAIFFEPYTRKFLFHAPPDLHRDWGRAGVNRAVIDKRAEADSLWSLLRTTLMPRPVETTFLYPPTGVGRFSELLAARIVAAGGRILFGRGVTDLVTDGLRVTAVSTDRETIACDGVVWTAPITEAGRLLGLDGVSLDYLSTIFYNLEIGAPAKLDFQWTYYGGDEIFSRVSTPVAFAPTMAPPGKSGLCVEVTCLEGDERWREPERLVDPVIADLVRTGTIDRAADVERVHVERVPFTYPIYRLDYLSELTRSLRELGRYRNLLLAGRSGRFWYNNMDHSIGQGLTMAERILRGDVLSEVDSADREFWQAPDADTPPAVAGVASAPVSAAAGAQGVDHVALPPAPARAVPGTVVAAPVLRRSLPAAAAIVGGSTVGLAWLVGGGASGVVYLAIYLLALVPGLPLGFALFGRRQAAGWVAGALMGYILTALAIWSVIAAGTPSGVTFVAAWAALSTITWAAYLRRRREPLVTLPVWRRQDTLALLLVLLLVPALVAPTFRNVGAVDDAGQERYRAYFTADFLWHAALTAELARFDMPPKDPYAGDQTLNYYWTYFLLPGAAAGVHPLGLWTHVKPMLLVNALASGLLFVGMAMVFVWSLVPRARAAAVAVSLTLLAPSVEGAHALYDAFSQGRPLGSVRDLNIDAITSWFFNGLTIDGLPRSLWYTPQHAMACAIGLVALVVAGKSARGLRWPAVLLAGVALGGSMMASPFLGGAFSGVYGLSVAIASAREWRALPRRLALHALAAVPVAAAFAWCHANQVVDGAGAAVHVGYTGPITQAPFVTPLLTLGPLLIAVAAGLWVNRRDRTGVLAPASAGLAVGFGLFYFVSLPGGDLVWVGWRAGQILLLTMAPLAARWVAAVFDARLFRPLGLAAIGVLFLAGLPTTIIDTYNAQDIWNRRMGPGFRWTIVVAPEERRALDWIRNTTAPTAIVQMEPTARGRETWTLIPSFAHRRMAAGLPISLLKRPEYGRRSARMRTLYGTEDPKVAWDIAMAHGIDFIYVDRVERRAFGKGVEKFNRPDYFRPVFSEGDVRVYEVVGSDATGSGG